MKHLLLTVAITTISSWQLVAQQPVKNSNRLDSTGRIERAEKKYQQLFAEQIIESKTDPELMGILQRFIFGEVFYIGNIGDSTRELITITALVVNQTLPQLKVHTAAALNIGVKPIQIREVVYQLAPFIGYPKILNALDTINSFQVGIQNPPG